MAKVYALIREDYYDCGSDDKNILGIFSTSEKATDAANEYIVKEWKEHSDEYTYRCPKTPLVYDDIHCNPWTFRRDMDDFSLIKIVDYDFDILKETL